MRDTECLDRLVLGWVVETLEAWQHDTRNIIGIESAGDRGDFGTLNHSRRDVVTTVGPLRLSKRKRRLLKQDGGLLLYFDNLAQHRRESCLECIAFLLQKPMTFLGPKVPRLENREHHAVGRGTLFRHGCLDMSEDRMPTKNYEQ